MEEMVVRWLPWKIIIKYLALSKGFIDPVLLLSKFNQFAQPSEVWAPLELLRAGALLHARGLINSQVVQHNLDWVWPYWAERQYDPLDSSFIPRAFSLTQINLTHRNWTATGLPGYKDFVVVDPSGLVMPYFDSWSIDFWVVVSHDSMLIPSRLKNAEQKLDFSSTLKITTSYHQKDIYLCSEVQPILRNGIPACRIDIRARVPKQGWLVIALRPYNMEGISFIHRVELSNSLKSWRVEKSRMVFFERAPQYYRFSNYKSGDVFNQILSDQKSNQTSIHCDIGMATAMVAYQALPSEESVATIYIPLEKSKKYHQIFSLDKTAGMVWEEARYGSCQLQFPFKNFQFLFQSALQTLLLHTPCESYAGPYTYKRFWFRDAAFIIHALLTVGLEERAERIINTFFTRQNQDGYFLSQDGEWDSNGEALWAMQRFCICSGKPPPGVWKNPIIKAAFWICRKRESNKQSGALRGLLPAGFSAEHLGPNDFYYWDDFWAVAGLRAASWMLEHLGDKTLSDLFNKEAEQFLTCINESIGIIAAKSGKQIIPASPNRRPDSSAVGSLAGGYPLSLLGCNDSRLSATAAYLFDNCIIHDAFYHDISHSGINPYLTLHIAEVFLRAGDLRYWVLMNGISALASPTGQWPEAIHPQINTGCMGDGQHVWAAAEWIVMVKNCLIREESDRDTLVLCSGVHPQILLEVKKITCGPVLTPFGRVFLEVVSEPQRVVVSWEGKWYKGMEPTIEIAFPGKERVRVDAGSSKYVFLHAGEQV